MVSCHDKDHEDCYCWATANKSRGDISDEEKKAYIAAMLCIMEKPSKLDPTQFPGAKSRYDDFVVVHMNQTMTIHGTVRSLAVSILLCQRQR